MRELVRWAKAWSNCIGFECGRLRDLERELEPNAE